MKIGARFWRVVKLEGFGGNVAGKLCGTPSEVCRDLVLVSSSSWRQLEALYYVSNKKFVIV